MKKNEKFKWTVFFLIRAVDEYWKDANEMICELRSISIDDKVCVLLCLNVDAQKLTDEYPRGEDPLSDGFTTLFYRLKKNEAEKNGEFRSSLQYINEKKDFDIRKPEDLSDYFKNKVLKKNKAAKYMLFTWDHGAAFGIFRDGEDDTIGVINEEPVKMLTMDQLQHAIHWSFGKKKIDIITMMNCKMQLFDSGYSLASAAKYLIAPETSMHWNGYNYKSIFELLSKRPGISSSGLANHIVLSFPDKKMPDTGRPYPENDVALFANRLKYYVRLGKLISRLGDLLTNEIQGKITFIADARSECAYIYSTMSLIDFFYFIKSLRSQFGDGWNKKLLKSIEMLGKKIVGNRYYIGSSFKNEKGPQKTAPSSFSFYFPDNSSRLCNYYSYTYFSKNSPSATSFTKKSGWVSFLQTYLQALENK